MSNPLIQGDYPSWVDIQIKLAILGGLTFVTADFSALKWKEGREGEEVPGAGPDPVGRTGGPYKAEAEMTMYQAKWIAFQTALDTIAMASNFGDKFGVPFDIIAQWAPAGLIPVNYTVKIPGARIKNIGSDYAVGAAPNSVVIPLSVIARIKQTSP